MASTMANIDAAFQGASDPRKMSLDAMDMVDGAQKFLKKSVNFILPGMLLMGGFGSIIHRVISYDSPRYGNDVVKTFLIMVMLQLLPVAALKLKTWLCSDLVTLMPMALTKTLMMHVAVQICRLMFHVYASLINSTMAVESWQQCFDFVSLCVALYILVKEFDMKVENLTGKEHLDVFTTVAGGCIMATIVNVIAPIDGRMVRLIWVLNDCGNYMEILAFVPVARILCLEIDVEGRGTSVCEDDRRKTRIFMAFILAFYFWDDICFSAALAEIPLVAAGKAAHFVMLLDFAGYFVLQAGAQPQIVDEILPKVLPEAILEEVLPKQDPEMGLPEKRGLLCDEDVEDLCLDEEGL